MAICKHCEEEIDPRRVDALRQLGEQATLCLKCAENEETRKKKIFAGMPIFPSVQVAEIIFAVPE